MRIPVWALCVAAVTGWSGFIHAETVGSIGVYVHDLDTDEPITSAKAILTREGDGPWSDTTNSRGNAVFRNMPEGEYVLSVFAEGYASAAQTLEVTFGPNLVFHTALGLQVSETGAIEGTVHGADVDPPAPLSGATVTLESLGVTVATGPWGAFEVPGAAAGLHEVEASHPDFYEDRATVEVAPGTTSEIAFTLTPVIPGDANRDRFVNALDVQLVINAVLGVRVIPGADVNRDGRVDAIDVQNVINAVLGL